MKHKVLSLALSLFTLPALASDLTCEATDFVQVDCFDHPMYLTISEGSPSATMLPLTHYEELKMGRCGWPPLQESIALP